MMETKELLELVGVCQRLKLPTVTLPVERLHTLLLENVHLRRLSERTRQEVAPVVGTGGAHPPTCECDKCWQALEATGP